MIRTACLAAVILMISPVAHAETKTYAINTQQSSIGLSWRAFGHSFSQAHLNGVTGYITLNPSQEWQDHIEVKIPVKTLVASNALLTYQLKSDLFFDAPHYPNIAFSSSRVSSLGEGKFQIIGTLSVKDVSRPVILIAKLDNGEIVAPTSNTMALHASTAISRTAFRVDRLVGIVDDRVDIELSIRAQRN